MNLNKKYDFKRLELIWYNFAGHLDMVDKKFHKDILISLYHCDDKIMEKVTREVLFISTSQHADAWRMSIKDIKLLEAKSLIFLSDNLHNMSQLKRIFIILHEIGHHILKHKSLLDELSTSEFYKQEMDADNFAKNVKKKIK